MRYSAYHIKHYIFNILFRHITYRKCYCINRSGEDEVILSNKIENDNDDDDDDDDDANNNKKMIMFNDLHY